MTSKLPIYVPLFFEALVAELNYDYKIISTFPLKERVTWKEFYLDILKMFDQHFQRLQKEYQRN
jgi:hypothetical protein